MINNIEILAPVGSMESLYAAVENGANAVYLGGKAFNARQYASNFEDEQLREAVKYAHIRNVRVYVTLNILLDDYELEEVVNYLTFLYNIDVDALIVQDLGLTRLIKNLFPNFELHGSTQMTVNNYMGAKFLEDLNFQRVVLARELSIDDVKYIKDTTDIELEGFIHGALCVSYSGQCLMSSMIGGRSGNRGRCAQPCRMPYTIVDLDSGNVISDEFEGKYLLSTKDLSTIDYLEDIAKSGITSLKIEGRMKRPEYVAIIVDRYKKALENLNSESHSFIVTEKDKKDLAQMFNRGFTRGYIMKAHGEEVMSIDRPDNRGIYIGKVNKTDKEYIYIKLDDSLNRGDGLEITNDGGSKTGVTVGSFYIGNKTVESAEAGEVAKIKKVRGIEKGDLVYKTSDIKLLTQAKSTYENNINNTKIKVFMAIQIVQNKPIALHIWDNKNHVTVHSVELVEESKSVSLIEEKIVRQMEKLGGTPYILKNIEIDLQENSMISLSILNKLRREGIDLLNEKRRNLNGRIEVKEEEVKMEAEKLLNFPGNQPDSKHKSSKISIKVSTTQQLNQLDLNKFDRIYLKPVDGIGDYLQEIKKSNKEIYLSTEKILNNEEFKDLYEQINKIDVSNINGISVSNMGTLKFVKDNFNTNIHCDIGLNIFNSSTVKLLEDYGAESITLSPELKLKQIDNIGKRSNILIEALGYGYLPLMITKHCPFSLIKRCKVNPQCKECRYGNNYGLKDRKNMVFPIERKNTTTVIYNSQPLIVLEHIQDIFNSHVDMIRLDFTIESDKIREIQNIYYDYVNSDIDKSELAKFINYFKAKQGLTKGHYFRGVL